MTTLPRLAPAETPISVLPAGPSQTFPKNRRLTHSSGSPKANGVSLSWDDSWSSKAQSAPNTASGLRNVRLDPLHPPKTRRTIYLETAEAHYQNDLQTYLRKREQYHRFHRSWMRPFYGDKVEQEDYKKGIRESLKGQMSAKEENHKKWMVDKIQESETAVKQDNKCMEDDKISFVKTKTYLMKFRDDNKKIMEEKEKESKTNRLQQYEHERDLLRYNPINWSKSLR